MTYKLREQLPNDNVATLLEDAEAEPVNLIPSSARATTLNQPIALGHKVALTDIGAREPIIKYEIRIGVATQDIHCLSTNTRFRQAILRAASRRLKRKAWARSSSRAAVRFRV